MKISHQNTSKFVLQALLAASTLAIATYFSPCMAKPSPTPSPSKLSGLPTKPATVSVKNKTAAQQYFYINLIPPSTVNPSYPSNEEISALSSVSSTVIGPNVVNGEGSITAIDSTHGYFFLNSGDTVSFATSPNNFAFSANIFTNGSKPGPNFPCDKQCAGYVDGNGNIKEREGRGATFAEFTINCDPTYELPDTADISEVNGVNALYQITFPRIFPDAASRHYPYFFCCSSYLFAHPTPTSWGKFVPGQYIPVPSIANHPGPTFPFTSDANGQLSPISPAESNSGGTPTIYSHGTVGVYPFGCDQCTKIQFPGCGSPSDYGNTQPQHHKICQVSRPVANVGGNITVELLEFPYPPLSKATRSTK